MNKSYVKLFIAGGLLLTATSAGVVMMPTSVSADDVVDEVNLTIPTACTMGGTIAQGDEHTVSLEPGTYRPNIGKTTMTTFCNDPGGFSIYAIGFTGEEYTGDNHTKLVGTTASNTISTGLTTGSNYTDESSWAMKLTAVDGIYSPTIMNGEDDTEDFTNYHVVPDTYTKVATFDTMTDAELHSGLGSRFETTYAVYAGITQAADTYNGKVKYTLVHPATETPLAPQTTQTGKICYYANAKDAVGTMGCQTIPTSGEVNGVSPTSATLLAGNFSRDGYGFAGWSDKFDYATNSNAKFYGPNETISYDATDYTGDNNGLSLYAVWVKSQGNLQDSTKVAEVCGSLTAASGTGANLSSISALTDQRDGNTYAIAKLADGNCWMIENLRLESADTVGNNRSDSSITNQSLAQGYGGQFAGLADPETVDKFMDTYSANSLYSNDGADNTINIGTSNTIYRMPRYNNLNTPASPSDRPQNPTSNSFTDNGTIVGMYSYGNYYSWHAAIADTTAYSSGGHNTTSICPTGWKIPLGDTSTGNIEQGASDAANKVPGFSYLDRKMGGTGQDQSTIAASLRWRKFPNNFVYSGSVNSGSVSNRGSYGGYWSSTASSSSYSYAFYLDSSYVSPGTTSSRKYIGWTVRCVVSGV